ncbi:MAG TPA: hypothetical protein VE153_19595 [Myxococcus sp.]|jgi:hypothetical protein|nr:hypothetical protein [Myxococcus sp.]
MSQKDPLPKVVPNPPPNAPTRRTPTIVPNPGSHPHPDTETQRPTPPPSTPPLKKS